MQRPETGKDLAKNSASVFQIRQVAGVAICSWGLALTVLAHMAAKRLSLLLQSTMAKAVASELSLSDS